MEEGEGSKVALPHSKVYVRCGGLHGESTQFIYVATSQLKLAYVILFTGWDVAGRTRDVQGVGSDTEDLHTFHSCIDTRQDLR